MKKQCNFFFSPLRFLEKWQRGTYITSHRGKHSQVPAYSSVSLWAYRIQQQTCNIRLGRLHTAQLEGEPHTFVAIIDKYFIIAVFRQMVLTCLEDNNGFSIFLYSSFSNPPFASLFPHPRPVLALLLYYLHFSDPDLCRAVHALPGHQFCLSLFQVFAVFCHHHRPMTRSARIPLFKVILLPLRPQG